MNTALINKIIPSSFVDGPGNRFVVFFQGCNLNCSYCHNPQTIGTCDICGVCIAHCPKHALKVEFQKIVVNQDQCCRCDTCLDVCPRKSTPHTRAYEVREIINELSRYAPFLSGITVSGGEATLWHEFIFELFSTIKSNPALKHLSCFIDSNGMCELAIWQKLTLVCDYVMLDLKGASEELHTKLTGSSNAQVLKSLEFLATTQKLFEVRIVVTSPWHTVPSELTLYAQLLEKLGLKQKFRLIPFRHHSVSKKTQIDYHTPTPQELKMVQSFLENF